MIRQLVETLAPATGVHMKWQPQGAEKGKVEMQVHGDTRAKSSQEELTSMCRRGQPSSLKVSNVHYFLHQI